MKKNSFLLKLLGFFDLICSMLFFMNFPPCVNISFLNFRLLGGFMFEGMSDDEDDFQSVSSLSVLVIFLYDMWVKVKLFPSLMCI